MKTSLLAMFSLLLMSGVSSAGTFVVTSESRTEMKAVYGQVEARDVVPARARLGGTIVSLTVDEGAAVQAGGVLATIVDDKLALQLQASDANIASAEAQLQNAGTELARIKRLKDAGVSPKAALDAAQTQYDVFASQATATKANKAVLEQQAAEGKVLAPAAGRVLRVPVTKGSVVMPGETMAELASGHYFLRLALPERHARKLKEGSSVDVGGAVGDAAALQHTSRGKLVKVYPQIEGGKVVADVEVDGLGDYFVGERILVRIPVDERQVIAVPASAILTRYGVDYVRLAGDGDVDVPVVTGEIFDTGKGMLIEVLSGLAAGDEVTTP